jgi:hypothetical protein
MVRIKDLTSTSASEIDDLADVRFGVDHMGLGGLTRQLSLSEILTEIAQVEILAMSSSTALTGKVTEVVGVRPSVAGLTLTVPNEKSALIWNYGPQPVAIAHAAGSTTVAVGESLHVRWTSITHAVTGPVGGTGAGQTDLGQTRNTGTYTVTSSTGTDINLITVDHIGPGLLPATTTMVISPPTGPPTEFTEYIWGFSHSTTGAIKAWKFDYEMALSSHGLTTAADRGKPVVIRPTPSSPAAVLDDTSQTQFPTGILKRADATRVVFCRPGDTIRVPTLLLEDGNSYSIDAKGRYLFWDLNAASGRSWRATKPVDSNPALPDLLEVIRVNQFGDSTFEACVRPAVPATLIAGAFQPIGQLDAGTTATPDVAVVSVVTSTGATFTNFLNGTQGQTITIFANDTTTINNNANIINSSGSNVTLTAGQKARYQRIGGLWRQI